MAGETVFQCPSCALQMTVSQLSGPSQVTCPTCFHRILLVPGQSPVEPDEAYLQEFDRLPAPLIIRTEVAKPATDQRLIRRAAKRAHKEANRESIRKARIRMVQVAVAVLISLGIATAAVTYGYRALRQVPKESWAGIVPGIESPEKLLREHARISEAFRETCGSIDDTSSRDRAIPKIRSLAAQFRGFPDRIGELGPLTPVHLQSIDPSFRDTIANDLRSTQEALRSVRSKRLLYSTNFFEALQLFSEASEAAAQAILTQWASPADAEPAGDKDDTMATETETESA